MRILPDRFNHHINQAVQSFWTSRDSLKSSNQEGGRGKVISGRNMQGFAGLVNQVVKYCGLPDHSVLVRKSSVILPGYFRATKNWDVLVVHERRLLAVFEFKSQVGAFGNNFNNRAEEAVGSATDLWTANHEGAYRSPGETSAGQGSLRDEPVINPILRAGGKPPFAGWLMLLEECPESMQPVSVDEPHFPVFPQFQGASYAERYRILCERLVERRLYDAAALVLARRPGPAGSAIRHRSLSDATSVRGLFSAFAGRLLGDLSAGS